MATSGTLTLSGTLTQAGIQQAVINLVLNLVSGNYSLTPVVLQAGFQNVAVPAGAQFAIIVMPPTNTIATTLKGATGDIGQRINPSGFDVIQFDAAAVPANIGLTSASTQTGLTTNIIFC